MSTDYYFDKFINDNNLETNEELVAAFKQFTFDAKKRTYNSIGCSWKDFGSEDVIDGIYSSSRLVARYVLHHQILKYCADNDVRPSHMTKKDVLDRVVPQDTWDQLILIPDDELTTYIDNAISNAISGYVTYMEKYTDEQMERIKSKKYEDKPIVEEEVETPIEEIVEEDHTIGLAVLYALLLFVVFWIVLDFHFVISVFCSIVLPYVITQWNKP